MKHEKLVVGGFRIVLVILIVLAGFGQAVLQLWNALVPRVFGLPGLSYWEAVGLMLLFWIMFGGLRGFGFMDGRRRCRCGREADGGSLSAEQRERLRSAMGSCGG